MIKSSKNQILNAEKTMLCTKIEHQILVLTAILEDSKTLIAQ